MQTIKLYNEPKTKQKPVIDQYLDKKFMRTLCQVIYYFGHGSCWYEEGRETFLIPPRLYQLWFFICNFYMFAVIGSEVVANFRTDLTFKEQNDIKQYTIGHITVYLKVMAFYKNRSKIKLLLKMLLEELRIPGIAMYQKDTVKRFKMFIAAISGTMHGCVLLATIDAFINHYKYGIPICSTVTYWPPQSAKGLFAHFTRFMVQTFVWYISTTLVILDALCLSALILLNFRFKALQNYFETLKEAFEDNVDGKEATELEDELKDNFIQGIKLHSKTIWCSRRLQDSLGVIYSAQVVQSISLLTIAMIKLVKVERHLSFLIAHLVFIFSTLALAGCYMVAGGDITYEASRVSTAMFHGGWELCRARARLRPLLVVALQCSDLPIVMTAFGVFDLSYANFITVCRSSYSFFAVTF